MGCSYTVTDAGVMVLVMCTGEGVAVVVCPFGLAAFPASSQRHSYQSRCRSDVLDGDVGTTERIRKLADDLESADNSVHGLAFTDTFFESRR